MEFLNGRGGIKARKHLATLRKVLLYEKTGTGRQVCRNFQTPILCGTHKDEDVGECET